MPKTTTLDNNPADREQDPMTIRKSRAKAASTKSKIARTGLKKSYCHTCEKTLSIAHFTVKKTGGKRKVKGEALIKPRKNPNPAAYAPLRDCNKCLGERRKNSGQYQRDKENKNKIYHSSEQQRKILREAGARARLLLADSYIKKLLKTKGYTAEEIKENPALIKEKRKEIKKLRKDAPNKIGEVRRKNGFYGKVAREELRASYLKMLIRNNVGYDGGKITKEMLKKKKEEVLHERATGAKVWVVRKTPQERKNKIKSTSDTRIKTLNDVYVKRLIKCSTWYKGEEITKEMIQAKRHEVLVLRDRKKRGVKTPRAVDRMGDGYMRKLIHMRTGIPKDEITFEQIINARGELEDKRLRRKQKKYSQLCR